MFKTEVRDIDGFTVHTLADGCDYYALLTDYLAGNVPSEWVFGIRDGKKWGAIFAWNERKFVLKYLAQKVKYWECKVSRLLNGPASERIMYKSNDAIAKGCDFIQRVYLAAERTREDGVIESYMLLEFIPGTPLREENPLPEREIADVVDRLHSYRLAMMDPHAANFIQTDQGLKIIDLSFRDSFLMGRAKDIVLAKRYMGVNLPVHGLVNRVMVWIVRLNHYLRNLSRRLRKHPKAY